MDVAKKELEKLRPRPGFWTRDTYCDAYVLIAKSRTAGQSYADHPRVALVQVGSIPSQPRPSSSNFVSRSRFADTNSFIGSATDQKRRL